MRIIPIMTKKEPTYQVVSDPLALSPLYPAFLITAKFKLDKKRCRIDVEVFRDILQIFPKLPNQEFVEPLSSDGATASFIKELGYKGDIESVTKIDNRNISDARKENMPYPRFTKAIIQHIISKDKLISMMNKWFMYTVQDDTLLGSLKFVSKTKEYQAYGALIPAEMTNLKMQNSSAYNTYLAFATGAATPKKERKFKKHASPSKKKNLVAFEELAKKPAKKPVARRKPSDMHQAGGLGDGVVLEPKVPNEQKSKSINAHEGIGLKPRVPDMSKADSLENDEEYRKINEEMYDDVNVELKGTELEGEGKDDEEMTDAGHVDAEHENVNQDSRGCSLDDALHKVLQRHTTEFIKEHFVSGDVVKVLKHQQKPQKSVKDIRKVKMEHALEQQESQYTIISFDKAALKEFDQKITSFEKMTKSKSFDRKPKHKALYHALMNSILEDEDVMDKEVADKLKKKKPNDADQDEDPPAGPDQWLKRKKTSKDVEPSKKDDLKDWFKKPKRPPIPNPEWNTGGSTDRTYTTSLTKTKAAKYDLYFTLWTQKTKIQWICFQQEIKVQRSDQKLYTSMEGDFLRLHLNDIEDMLLLVVQNRLNNLDGEVIMHYLAALRRRRTRLESLTDNHILPTQTPKDLSILDKLERNRLMCSHELYKFNDDTLISVRDQLKDIANNMEMRYTKVMPRKRWSNLDKKRARIMTPKDLSILDKLERNRLMCSHELYKFNDDTLISVRDQLKDIANNMEMRYTKVMPRKRWSNLDKKRARIMNIRVILNIHNDDGNPSRANIKQALRDEVLKLKNFKKDAPVMLSSYSIKKSMIKQTYEPTFIEEKLDRKNEIKARGTLLMALPNKDQLKFHSYQDEKLLMEAIAERYGGNKESKKVQRTLLKKQYENFVASSSKTLDQTFD
nr:hypothetical protein [Tanacetum cinerariifolium]